MALVYNKLWDLLSAKSIPKAKFREMVDLSKSTLARLEKNETVMTDTLDRICEALNCDISDIVAYVPFDEKHNRLVFRMNSFSLELVDLM